MTAAATWPQNDQPPSRGVLSEFHERSSQNMGTKLSLLIEIRINIKINCDNLKFMIKLMLINKHKHTQPTRGLNVRGKSNVCTIERLCVSL